MEATLGFEPSSPLLQNGTLPEPVADRDVMCTDVMLDEGVEPSYAVRKAAVLTVRRIERVPREGIEPSLSVRETAVLTARRTGRGWSTSRSVGGAGGEIRTRISRVQAEGPAVERHQPDCALRRQDSNLRTAGQNRGSCRWTTPQQERRERIAGVEPACLGWRPSTSAARTDPHD